MQFNSIAVTTAAIALLSFTPAIASVSLFTGNTNGTVAGQISVLSGGIDHTANHVTLQYFSQQGCNGGNLGSAFTVAVGNRSIIPSSTVGILGEALWSIGNFKGYSMSDDMSIKLTSVCDGSACTTISDDKIFTGSISVGCYEVDCGTGSVCQPDGAVESFPETLKST